MLLQHTVYRHRPSYIIVVIIIDIDIIAPQKSAIVG